MKKIILAFTLPLFAIPIFSQNTGTPPKQTEEENIVVERPSSEVYTIVEVMPEYVGGEAEMQKFLMRNINYPKDALEKNIEGKAFVKFMVDEFGNVGSVSVLRAPYPSIGAEAVRVIKLMPRWKPGKQSGKAVRVWFTLPIDFRLQ